MHTQWRAQHTFTTLVARQQRVDQTRNNSNLVINVCSYLNAHWDLNLLRCLDAQIRNTVQVLTTSDRWHTLQQDDTLLSSPIVYLAKLGQSKADAILSTEHEENLLEVAKPLPQLFCAYMQRKGSMSLSPQHFLPRWRNPAPAYMLESFRNRKQSNTYQSNSSVEYECHDSTKDKAFTK